MAVSPMNRFTDIVFGAPLRLKALQAGFQAGMCGLELGNRMAETALSIFTQRKFVNCMGAQTRPEVSNHGFSEVKEEVESEEKRGVKKEASKAPTLTERFWSIIDVRMEHKYLEPMDLVKEGLRCTAISVAARVLADLTVGKPIMGFNLIGGFLGLNVLSSGISENIPSLQQWKGFFNRMS